MPFSCRAARISTDSVIVTVSFMAVVLVWRTAESNRAGPALLVTNPVVHVCLPCAVSPQFPYTVPLAYLGMGLRG